MSTLQVSNIHFESTGNNRLQYTGSNSFNLVGGGVTVATINSNSVIFPVNFAVNNFVANASISVGSILVANSTVVNATHLGGIAFSSYQLNSTLSANVATLTANNTSFVGTVSAVNVVSNSQLSSNLANYVTTTNFTNNLANYVTTTNFTNNLANYVTTTNFTNNLANYQTTAGLSANVSKLASNSALYANASITNSFTIGTANYFVANGNFGIGNTSPAHKLRVEGDISSSGVVIATDFNSVSDITFKKDIVTLTNCFSILEKIRPVSFNWIENDKKSYGLIAQELENALPELVRKDDIKTVNYIPIIAILISAVKELNEKIK